MNQYKLGKLKVGDMVKIKPKCNHYPLKNIDFNNKTFRVIWIYSLKNRKTPTMGFMYSYIRVIGPDGKTYQFRFYEIDSIERG